MRTGRHGAHVVGPVVLGPGTGTPYAAQIRSCLTAELDAVLQRNINHVNSTIIAKVRNDLNRRWFF